MQNQSLQMIKRIFQSALGLFLYACGIYLTMQADIGLAPWDCLSMGASFKTGISYGIVHTAISIGILLIDLLLKERIGFGTILDTLLVGNYVDLIAYFHPLPHSESLPLSILFIVIALFLMAYGQYFYMIAGLCCGPRDSLLIALGKRFPKVPIGVVQTAIIGVALLIGWLLGGPVGIGTVITVCGLGAALQIICRLLRFEPRTVVHQGLVESTRILQGKQ